MRVTFVTGATGQGLGQSITEMLLFDEAFKGRFLVYAATRDVARVCEVFNGKHSDAQGGTTSFVKSPASDRIMRGTSLFANLRFVQLDFMDSDQKVEEAVRAVELDLEAEGKGESIDLLLNCAGMGRDWPLECETSETMSQCLRVNLQGPILLCKAVLPAMKRKHLQQRATCGGQIVNVTSIGGLVIDNMVELYTAAKYGLTGFSECLAETAKEFGIKVTAVIPGPMDTPALWESVETVTEYPGKEALDDKTKALIAAKGVMVDQFKEARMAVPPERAARQILEGVVENENPKLLHVMAFGFNEDKLSEKFAPGFLDRPVFGG